MSATGGPVVDVRDAFCLYPVPDGAVAALRGITLTVVAGERVVVHGPNGSGKTTLLRVLAGQQRLSAGRAVVTGIDLAAAGPAVLARWRNTRVGWIDQHPARMLRPELGVLDNVALQLRLAGRDAGAARERAGQLLHRLGVGGLAGRPPAGLSGGEAQRVAVCAALAHGPDLVLADEPTGELDARSAVQVYDALAEAVAEAGAALVLVSHDRTAARVADRVVRIRDGRLSETWHPGPAEPEELLVVDDRGWLRLPERLRCASGTGGAVRPRLERGGIRLDPVARPGGSGTVSAGGAAIGHARGDAAAPVSGGSAPTPSAGAGGVDVVARLDAVHKSYRRRSVLSGVSLSVPAARVLVIRGRSGAGKSTLLRVLTGLERPDAGSVRLAGQDLAGLDRSGLAALRRSLTAVIGQDVHLAETATVLANLELARAVRGLRSDRDGDREMLTALGLAGLAHRRPGLLSGGERQRVAVARALVVRPRLAVLDEPTAQLDEAAAENLAAVLRAAAVRGAAVVLASHDPVLVAAADLVVDLEPVRAPDIRSGGSQAITGAGNS